MSDPFGRRRGRCYRDAASSAGRVGVLVDATTRYHGPGTRAIAARARQHPPTRGRAAYDKLARPPLAPAQGWGVRATAAGSG